MNSEIILRPIAFVKNSREEKLDGNWSDFVSEIEIVDELPIECLDGIETFSHLEIIFHFDKATKIVEGSEHPRGNPNWPKVGIFAQRKKDRPNHLGLTTVELIRKQNRKLIVSILDAINGTPILDIKPVFNEYLPKGNIIQPGWSKSLMKNYWKKD